MMIVGLEFIHQKHGTCDQIKNYCRIMTASETSEFYTSILNLNRTASVPMAAIWKHVFRTEQ